MRARTIMLGAVLAGCSGGGDDGGAAARFEPIEGPADTVRYAAAGDALVALVATAGFKAETIGDVAAYVNSEATTPTAPTVKVATIPVVQATRRARATSCAVQRSTPSGANCTTRRS